MTEQCCHECIAFDNCKTGTKCTRESNDCQFCSWWEGCDPCPLFRSFIDLDIITIKHWLREWEIRQTGPNHLHGMSVTANWSGPGQVYYLLTRRFLANERVRVGLEHQITVTELRQAWDQAGNLFPIFDDMNRKFQKAISGSDT